MGREIWVHKFYQPTWQWHDPMWVSTIPKVYGTSHSPFEIQTKQIKDAQREWIVFLILLHKLKLITSPTSPLAPRSVFYLLTKDLHPKFQYYTSIGKSSKVNTWIYLLKWNAWRKERIRNVIKIECTIKIYDASNLIPQVLAFFYLYLVKVKFL
jgi:hypothetical protein